MTNEDYIKRCIQLAKNGSAITYPNPSVGAVIVCNNTIIGEGFTSKYGGNHAEVNAINSVKNKSLLVNSTIYVTLEPCSHFGKTPPCSDLIIRHKIPNVIIGCIDDNTLVAGKGVKRLKAAGVNVIVGVLENECKELHKRFFTFHNKKRPYIFLKWAQSLDHFLSPEPNNKREPVWITNQYSKQQVHKQRANEQAILVGTTTVVADNPSLSTRLWKGTNCTRVVIDLKNRIPSNSVIFDESQPTIIITSNNKQENKENLVFEVINDTSNLPLQICDILYKYKLQSLIVEGGTKTIQSFIDNNLWDEAFVYTGTQTTFKKGTKAPSFNKNAQLLNSTLIKTDRLTHYKND